MTPGSKFSSPSSTWIWLSTRRSHRVKPESTDAETPGPSDSRRGARGTAKKSKTATRQPSVKPELLEEGDADHDTSPQKPKPTRKSKKKAVAQRLETPHPTPANWADAYAAIKVMRARIVAPVDTMGCDRAQFGEREPKTKDEVTDAAVAKLRTALGGALSVQAVISEAIAKVGFWRRKTQYIKQTAQRLHDAFDADVPKTVEELLVWHLCVCFFAMQCICLEYLWPSSIASRLETMARPTDKEPRRDEVRYVTLSSLPLSSPRRANQMDTRRVNLESWLPKDLHGEINHFARWSLFLIPGSTICLPVGPKCGDCTLSAAGLCPSAQSAKTRTKTSKTAVRTGSGSPKEEDVQEGSGPKMEIKIETERPRDRENMESGLVKEEV
ncbi:hypothetical protein JVT61DRAFT_15420 [Boletus reticuloceps]|uniref:Uncharacterized protein n=1 Tax=Boletus reticuloceps TaxID=495285 RepID=A0A8I2YVX2_9AGAM|nr:hypothetical protein JVT61DRAFT_15420 [Boletus reticuloceps]